MAIRLPNVGQDDGTWGQLLNDFLGVEHNGDGTLKKATDISTAKTLASSAVQSVNGKNGPTVTLAAADVSAVASSAVGQNNGVAPLDSTGKVPSANLPAVNNAVNSVNGQTGVVVIGESDISGLTTDLAAKYTTPANGIPKTDLESAVQTSLTKADSSLNQSTADGLYVPLTDKGAVSGVATLDGSGHIPSAQLPAGVGTISVAQDGTATGAQPEINFVSGSNVTLVASEDTVNNKIDVTINSTAGGTGSATLSGDTDVAITTPANGEVLTYNTTSTKWENKPAPSAPVTSVNAKTGAVVLGITDIASLQSSLNAKAPSASPTFTGTVTVPAPSGSTDAATKAYVDANTANATTSAPGQVQLAGDLSGTATSPKVAKVNGVAVSGTPTAGQVLTASNGTTAAWATPSGGSGGSGYQYTYVTKTTNYTANNLEFVFVTDVSAGAVTITLPTPVANGYVSVKRFAPSGNALQVAAPAGSYIDASGVGTATVNSQYQSQDFLSDGTNWFRV